MPEAPRTAVDKALDLVEAVARSPQPPRLTDLAEAVDLHRATAYRILLDLVRRGWVLRAGDRYLPGTAVLQLSAAATRHSLVALARPVLLGLSEATEMMVNLQVLEEDRSRVIDVVRPERLGMITRLLGEALPVHRFAAPWPWSPRSNRRRARPISARPRRRGTRSTVPKDWRRRSNTPGGPGSPSSTAATRSPSPR
ncbi:helix-turn-helix domain-containing protein [Streptomyces kaempferi]